jgi:hypothetical protein
MTQSIMGHSGSPSGSVYLLHPLPVIGWSGMHHSGCRRTPIASFRPLPCRMRPEIHDGGQSFYMLCAQQRTSQNSVLCEVRRTPSRRTSENSYSTHSGE